MWLDDYNYEGVKSTCLQVSTLKDILSFLVKYFSNWASKFLKSLFHWTRASKLWHLGTEFGFHVAVCPFTPHIWSDEGPERRVLAQMRPEVPGPFAVCLSPSSRNRWCCYKCCDMHLGGGSLWITMRIAFLESHSAFDTIQLLPLGEKLCGQCNDLLDQWLPHRQATGCVSGQCDSVLSDVVVSDTGAPLLPFLFSLYTTEGRRCLHSYYGSKKRWWGIRRATNTYEWRVESTEWTGNLIFKQ